MEASSTLDMVAMPYRVLSEHVYTLAAHTLCSLKHKKLSASWCLDDK